MLKEFCLWVLLLNLASISALTIGSSDSTQAAEYVAGTTLPSASEWLPEASNSLSAIANSIWPVHHSDTRSLKASLECESLNVTRGCVHSPRDGRCGLEALEAQTWLCQFLELLDSTKRLLSLLRVPSSADEFIQQDDPQPVPPASPLPQRPLSSPSFQFQQTRLLSSEDTGHNESAFDKDAHGSASQGLANIMRDDGQGGMYSYVSGQSFIQVSSGRLP